VQRVGSDYVVPPAPQTSNPNIARVALDAVPARRSGGGYFRPAAAAASPIQPRNDALVLPDAATFHWHRVTGATDYTVQVRRIDVPGHVRIRAGADTTWTPEPGSLESGVAYEWLVLSDAGTRLGMPATFRVIDAAAWAAVQARLDEIAGMALGEHGTLLLSALVYRDAGLLYEARRTFDVLARADAALSGDMRAIHADVLDALGDAAGAARILETLRLHQPE
jgi:hypothetical protein